LESKAPPVSYTDRSAAVGDAVLPGVRSAARRNAVSKRISFPGLGIIAMSRPAAVSVRHGSRAAPSAGSLEICIIKFTNADSSLGQLRDADFPGRDDAPTGGFAEPVEGTPSFEGKNPLRGSAGLPTRRVFKRHIGKPANELDRPGKSRTPTDPDI
jgi:hypothetical protein